MLSRHPESCRFPHGHTRQIEVVVSGQELDENGMLLDFKALKLAIEEYLERYDHALAVNSADPALPSLQAHFPEQAFVVFHDAEPTTENMAKEIFYYVASVLRDGFEHGPYRIEPGMVSLESVRVWETPNTWAEFSES